MNVDAQIEALAQRRSDIWAGRDVGDLESIASKLRDLYEERRHERARDRSGRTREEITKRARIESELERLMAERTIPLA